jgi:N-acetylglucosaminyl-diphospho-decaprenol L-rhamnosyltransferase
MLLRSEVFKKVGMFTEDYFMYAEDIDLNWKVHALGLSNYYLEDAQIIHHGGRSSSRQKVSQWSTLMMYTAMLRYYEKNRSPLYASLYRTAMGVSAVVRLFILAIISPFADKEVIEAASAKWRTVLKWAFGRGDQTIISAKPKAEVRA